MIAIIHHGGCVDGTTAAWVAWDAMGRGVSEPIRIIPAAYNMPLPEFTERPRATLVVDFSWPYEQMLELAERTDDLMLLDHHKTALDDIGPHADPGASASDIEIGLRTYGDCRFVAQLDMERSGAMLTWNWFHRADPPALVQYVQDRDLWRWELPHSREIGSLLLTAGETVEEIEEFAQLTGAELIQRGRGAHAFELAAVRSVLKNAYWCTMVAPDGERRDFPIFASPYILGSTACEQLIEREGSKMAGYFIERTDGKTQYGFRGHLVNEWAERFPGGGGHPSAAGCTIDGPPVHMRIAS